MSDDATDADELWDDLLPFQPYAKPPGEELMLRVIAYDITSPRRLRRVAKVCEDYGARVQFSLFECWLENDRLERLWRKLNDEIEPEEDRLVCYTIDAAGARKRMAAGDGMALTERQAAIFL